MSVEDREQERLAADLWAAFEADPFEDGMRHPAEEIIEEALQSRESQRVLEWLKDLSLDATHPSFSAEVLRCLGRQTQPGTVSWRTELVRDGLAVDDVEMRDAAIHAAEWWGDPDMRNVLESHSAPRRRPNWIGQRARLQPGGDVGSVYMKRAVNSSARHGVR